MLHTHTHMHKRKRQSIEDCYKLPVWRVVVCALLLLGLVLVVLQVASPLLFGIPVADVAKAMILDAQAFKRGQAHGGPAATFADFALRKAASSGQAPQ